MLHRLHWQAIVEPLMQQGYAIVGVIVDESQKDPYTNLGER
jgi:hypothetical protein